MKNKDKRVLINLFEGILKQLRTKGKSIVLADLLMDMSISVTAPSKEYNLFIEFSLAANPNEETGVGCKSLSGLRQMLDEYSS